MVNEILAIDPATVTGICYRDKTELVAKSWVLGEKGDSKQQRLYKFFRELKETLLANENITHIAYERPAGSHFVGVQFHANIEGIILFVCHLYNKVPYPVSAKSIKKVITGSGNATKGEMLNKIREMGHSVSDHNEADAVGIYLFTKSKLDA
jgi:crossover junction endodeoxyribonuclease RuvC